MCWLAISFAGLLIASLSVLGYVVVLDLYSPQLEMWHMMLVLLFFTVTATFGIALCLDSLPFCQRAQKDVVDINKLH